MKNSKVAVLLAGVVFALGFASIKTIAAEGKRESASKGGSTDSERFRCQKFEARTLSTLKEKMLNDCDLNKPFSSNVSKGIAGDDLYMFCCHTKGE